jgi:large subunit ribosomal protein L30
MKQAKPTTLVAVRIRGIEGVHYNVRTTLDMLHLYRKNFCSVVANNPGNLGMLKKAKDYITWGAVDEETLKMLYEKRGLPYRGDLERKREYVVVGGKKLKRFFRLHPPLGGFERKGTKTPFAMGGALGDRKEKINELLKKMI